MFFLLCRGWLPKWKLYRPFLEEDARHLFCFHVVLCKLPLYEQLQSFTPLRLNWSHPEHDRPLLLTKCWQPPLLRWIYQTLFTFLIVSSATAVSCWQNSSFKAHFCCSFHTPWVENNFPFKPFFWDPCQAFLPTVNCLFIFIATLYCPLQVCPGPFFFTLSGVWWSFGTLGAVPPLKPISYLAEQNAFWFPLDCFCRYGPLRWDLYLVQHHQQAERALNLGCCLVTSPRSVRLTTNRLSGSLPIFFQSLNLFSGLELIKVECSSKCFADAAPVWPAWAAGSQERKRIGSSKWIYWKGFPLVNVRAHRTNSSCMTPQPLLWSTLFINNLFPKIIVCSIPFTWKSQPLVHL